jgi:hypothetical protein
MPTNSKLRRTLALVLAGGSLAIGVPAALAAGGGDDSAGDRGDTAPSSGFVQDDQNRPDHDCPERGGDDGNGGGGSGDEGSGASGGATTTPSV